MTRQLERFTVQTQQELGIVLGVNERTVRRYLDSGLPAAGPNGYDVGHCVAWYMKSLTDGGFASPETVKRKRQAELRYTESCAELKQLEIDRLTGKLIQIDVIVRHLARTNAATRRRLERMAGELAPTLPESLRHHTTALIADAVRNCLTDLADTSDTGPTDFESGEVTPNQKHPHCER